MPIDPHVLGEEFELLITAATVNPDGTTTGVNLTAIPVTAVIDGPGSVRRTLRYLNGGTDGVLETNTFGVRFTKPPSWSVAFLSAGDWDVRILIGVAETVQDHVGATKMNVIMPRGGALPIVGV